MKKDYFDGKFYAKDTEERLTYKDAHLEEGISLDSIYGQTEQVVKELLESSNPVSYTHLDVYKRQAVEVMARKGIDISAHISRPVEYEDIENADLVITMTEAHKSMLLFGYPEFATKIYTLSEMLGEFWGDVIDPFGQGLEAYERTADFLEDSLRVLAKRLAGLDV